MIDIKTDAAQNIKITFNTCATDHNAVEVALKAALGDLGFRHVGAEGGAFGSELQLLFDRDLMLEETILENKR